MAAFLNSACAAPPPGQAVFGVPHVFTGLGVHLWPASKDVAARDRLMRDLHVAFVRVGLGSCLPPGQLVKAPGQANFHALDAQCRRTELAPAGDAFRDEMAALGVRLHLIFWDMPPPWRIDQGAAHYADPVHLTDMAQWLTAELLGLRRRGFDPAAVELTNEPNGIWNTQYNPQDYATLVSLTRTAFDAAGLQSILIEGPGTSNDTDGRFLQAVAPLAALHQLGLLSVHEYDTKRVAEPAGLRLTNPDIARFGIDLPVYVTEFRSDSPKWQTAPYDPKAYRDSPGFAANSREFGVSAAGEALKLLADGAAAIFYWDLEDLEWAPPTAGSGLLTLHGQRRPAADALAVAFHGARPGAQVASLAAGPPTLVVLRFQDDKGLTVVAANLGTTPVGLNVCLNTTSPDARLTRVGSYRATDLEVIEDDTLRFEKGTLRGIVGSRSIISVELN